MTQYMSGGLHRWVRYGCRTVTEVKASTNPADRELLSSIEDEEVMAWEDAIARWSTLESLEEDRENSPRLRHKVAKLAKVGVLAEVD